MLSLQNISKRFDGKPALSALSLDIHEGEFVVREKHPAAPARRAGAGQRRTNLAA